MGALDIIRQRRDGTAAILQRFHDEMVAELGADLDQVIDGHTTVYVTGSGGRGEMSEASDLDLFLVRIEGRPSRIDGALLQAAIVRATRKCGIEDASADGVFLDLHSADEFDQLFGTPDDDARNKFTPRMLLLLESRPVLGHDVYHKLVDKTLERYWQNKEKHKTGYLPYVFVNDVVRWWRVVLLNHEWKLNEKLKKLAKEKQGEDLVHEIDAERYYRSYKLRFARCLTCFASLAYLLARTRDDATAHVSIDDMKKMVGMTPFERLEAVADTNPPQKASDAIAEMRDLYAEFLEHSARPKKELIESFKSHDFAKAHSGAGRRFADLVFILVSELGKDSSLYRYMVV